MSYQIIKVNNLVKKYDNEVVVDNINFYVNSEEFVTILGPSGCGKTTTLRMIGGFEVPDGGEILFKDKRVNDIPSNKRDVNTVFQKYALFPHLNIYENIAFGLRIKKIKESEIKNRVREALEMVRLVGYEKRSINAISGGQQQRVAIARAIVNKPKVLLLDEPLGALDLKLRKTMQIELKRMQQQLGITFIYVTHDQEEALTMSDTIIVMNDGKIQQIGTPIDIYNEPENAFVADFIGESNIFDGVMKEDYKIFFENGTFECVDSGFNKNENVDVVIRPEDINLSSNIDDGILGKVKSVIFKGVHYEMVVETNFNKWLIHSTKCFKIGEKVSIFFTPEDIHIMRKGE